MGVKFEGGSGWWEGCKKRAVESEGQDFGFDGVVKKIDTTIERSRKNTALDSARQAERLGRRYCGAGWRHFFLSWRFPRDDEGLGFGGLAVACRLVTNPLG